MSEGRAIFIHDLCFGDAGKGKITDYLAEDPEVSVIFRYQGGNNAGHTIKVGETVYKMHLVPTGILHEEKLCLIGNGTVVDPRSLLIEMDELRAGGLTLENLRISPHAHLIMPYHTQLDYAEEEARSPENKIGTTRKGIGPCYADKASRSGIRIADALDLEYLEKRIENALIAKQGVLGDYPEDVLGTGLNVLDVGAVAKTVYEHVKLLEPYLADTTRLLWDALDAGKTVLGEGAQSTMLDIDHGTYPFVTSSNCLPGAAAAGIGLPLDVIDKVVCVVKAYPTRVDTVGSFPSKMRFSDPEIEELIVERGHEYGATTGRRRRCGWNDVPMLKFSARLSSGTEIALTKLDIMHDIPLKLCVAYENEAGNRIDDYPTDHRELEKMKPIYEPAGEFGSDISEARTYDELPAGAKEYVEKIESAVGVPVTFIGVGMGRDQIIAR